MKDQFSSSFLEASFASQKSKTVFKTWLKTTRATCVCVLVCEELLQRNFSRAGAKLHPSALECATQLLLFVFGCYRYSDERCLCS